MIWSINIIINWSCCRCHFIIRNSQKWLYQNFANKDKLSPTHFKFQNLSTSQNHWTVFMRGGIGVFFQNFLKKILNTFLSRYKQFSLNLQKTQRFIEWEKNVHNLQGSYIFIQDTVQIEPLSLKQPENWALLTMLR